MTPFCSGEFSPHLDRKSSDFMVCFQPPTQTEDCNGSRYTNGKEQGLLITCIALVICRKLFRTDAAIIRIHGGN